MTKRLLWKSFTLNSFESVRRVQGTWISSKHAFGKGRVFHMENNYVETNLPISDLRTLLLSANVKIDFRNGIVWDTEPRLSIERD